MKIKHLFLAAFAAVAMVLTSCNKEDDLGAANVSVEKATVTLEAGEGSETITFTATRDWTLSCPDWIAPSAKSGKASSSKQTVTISVEENAGNDRTGDVVISIGLAKATVSVTQKGAQGKYEAEEGDGSKDKPFNVAQACAAVKNLSYTDNTNYEKVGPYYVRGKVVSIKEAFSAEYGNAQFTISDDGSAEGDQFVCYRVYYLENKKWVEGNTQIQVGDVAVIYGELMNFKGNTPENVQKGSYLYSLNGETTATGGTEVDYNNAPAKTVAEFIAAADTQTYYKLTGTISGINAQYGNFDLTDATGSIYVYGAKNWNEFKDKATDGATVVLAGQYKLYQKEGQADKHEVVNAYILSAEGGVAPVDEDAKGEGTLESPYNPKAAYDVAAALEKDAKTANDVYVAGKIASIKYTFSAQYGTATFYISEDGTTSGTQFPCYSVLYLGNRAWVDGDTQVKVGDEVIVCGKLVNYGGNTPETASKEAYIYSLNGDTDGGEVVIPLNVKSFSQTTDGFTASWDAYNGAVGGYVWMVFDESQLAEEEAAAKVARRLVAGLRDGDGEEGDMPDPHGYGYTEETAISVPFGYNDEEGYFLLENFEVGMTYYLMVIALGEEDAEGYYEEIGDGYASFVARDMSQSGDGVTIELSFATCPEGFPNGSAAGIQDGTYTLGGYSFTFHAADKFYWNSDGYILIGKKDSWILLPAIEGKALKTVAFKTGAKASENVIVDIADVNGNCKGINTSKLPKGTEFEWTVNGEVGAAYSLYVTNAYNAQYQNLTLYYE